MGTLQDWRQVLEVGTTSDNNLYEFVIPNQQEWWIKWIQVAFTTASSAGGAVRQLLMLIKSSTADSDEVLRIAPDATQDSGLTYYYNFYPGAPTSTGVFSTDQAQIPIPPNLILRPGWAIDIRETDSVDTDDDDLIATIAAQMRRVLSTSV